MSDMDVKNEIDDIVMDMDKLSKQEMATECQECPTPTDLEVPFCCVTNLPKGFDVVTDGGGARKSLVYDVSCLHCCLEPCEIKVMINCCNTPIENTIDGFSVKIVGCIKYIASAFPVIGNPDPLCGGRFQPSGNEVRDQEGEGHVCCQGCVCVDEIIGCVTCDGSCACDCPPISCTTVTVKEFTVAKLPQCNEDQTPVQFTGKFIIPGCV